MSVGRLREDSQLEIMVDHLDETITLTEVPPNHTPADWQAAPRVVLDAADQIALCRQIEELQTDASTDATGTDRTSAIKA